MQQGNNTFSGTWFCWHWYPSQDDTQEEVSKYQMKAYHKGRDIVFQSEPNNDKSYMFIRLSIDGDLATGTWYETTSPTGTFEGASYSGAGQLLVSDDQQHMEGQWAGVGHDHVAQQKRIYTGRWKLSRTDEE